MMRYINRQWHWRLGRPTGLNLNTIASTNLAVISNKIVVIICNDYLDSLWGLRLLQWLGGICSLYSFTIMHAHTVEQGFILVKLCRLSSPSHPLSEFSVQWLRRKDWSDCEGHRIRYAWACSTLIRSRFSVQKVEVIETETRSLTICIDLKPFYVFTFLIHTC